jgi:membrane-bound serine protease (ClpP class)
MGVVITLILVGVLLLVLETFLPGLVVGAIGVICLFAAVIWAYVNVGSGTGTIVLALVVFGLIVGTALWMRYLPRSRFARRFASEQAVGDIGTERPELLHQTGTALTPLRPCGTAVINGHRVDVVTEGGMIERRTPVKVVAVEGIRVVVRALDSISEPTTNS